MNFITMISIALACGMGIALQSGMSGQLGRLLGNPMFATLVVFVVSATIMATVVLTTGVKLPSMMTLRAIPVYLWGAGSLLSAAALTGVYWLMPQMGVPGVMVGVLCGQLLISLLAGHYGWFDMPVVVVTPQKLVGAGLLVLGILLINVEVPG
ncbi:DMT family transporter [Paremcibacter congregatus]|uniref:EamA-like transporter family protein n=1 Tax=Paremcibacter congregatus TaxID=2043170 RepID=A0A2G4YW72_9PROT|nr:DMT family transporter [Paremcibacter congregatus]PHZ85686.1 hypothetical protein CRD36_03080 [Paremcibacter congregatus]|tara:strand:+ start:207 stop:665 length:459 start_codon:yes stop_codon:yes gene_type:complete